MTWMPVAATSERPKGSFQLSQQPVHYRQDEQQAE